MSTEHPDTATMSALVDTADINRERDPISPVRSEEGRSLRHIRTLHRSVPLQKRTDMNLFRPESSNSTEKHCSAVTCSAISSMAQMKKCWKKAWEYNNRDLNSQS